MRELVEARGLAAVPASLLTGLLADREEAFSEIKALLRLTRARTREALVEAMGRALDAVTAQDVRGGSPIAAILSLSGCENCCRCEFSANHNIFWDIHLASPVTSAIPLTSELSIALVGLDTLAANKESRRASRKGNSALRRGRKATNLSLERGRRAA